MKIKKSDFNSLKVKTFLFLTVILVLTTASLADELTLDAAVQQAVDHSPEIQVSQAVHEQASGRKQESLSGFLPSLWATGYHFTDVKYENFAVTGFGVGVLNVPVVLPQTSLKLSATLPIFDGLRNVNDFRSASAAEQSASNQNDWREFEIKQEVKRAYYRALAAELLAEVASENIKTLEDHSMHVEARKRGGIETQYDVLRVQVQLEEARSQKLLADDNVILERKRLARTIGLPDDTTKLSGKLPEPTTVANIQTLTVESALQHRADLIALTKGEEASDYAHAAEATWWSPSVGLFTDYEFYNNTNSALLDSNYFHNAYDVGVSLKWNLFDGGSSIAKARQSTGKLKQSQAALLVESQKLPENLEIWKRRYVYGVALYKTATSNIRKSEESVKQAQEGFKQGIRTVSEQLDAQLDLFRSRATQVNAELTAAEAWIDLELTMGRKLENGSLN